MERAKIKNATPVANTTLSNHLDKNTRFFSSGSTLLDLALGGGWAIPRIFNIVGDRSSGKTGCAVEAFANFKMAFPTGRMRYAEAEAAFDDAFADILGFPPEVTKPGKKLNTVEEFRDDLRAFAKVGGPSLYILDSLDALSDSAEMERVAARDAGKKEKGSYGAEKAKEMSELFRTLTVDMASWDCSLGIISQIRDKIGVTFGETKMRSGGHALDFYASQVLWLIETGKLKRSYMNEERAIGIQVSGKVKKNKVGMPFRVVDWEYIFAYGIDDELSMLNWLMARGQYKNEVPDPRDPEGKKKKSYGEVLKQDLIKAREKNDYGTILQLRSQLIQDTKTIWKKIEEEIAPPMRKYGNVVAPPSTPPPPPLAATKGHAQPEKEVSMNGSNGASTSTATITETSKQD